MSFEGLLQPKLLYDSMIIKIDVHAWEKCNYSITSVVCDSASQES